MWEAEREAYYGHWRETDLTYCFGAPKSIDESTSNLR
jgi:hypothetical protein